MSDPRCPKKIEAGQVWTVAGRTRTVLEVWSWDELRALLARVRLTTPRDLRNSRVRYGDGRGREHWCNLSTFYSWSRKGEVGDE